MIISASYYNIARKREALLIIWRLEYYLAFGGMAEACMQLAGNFSAGGVRRAGIL